MPRSLISTGSIFEKKAGFYSRALVDGAWCFVSGCTGLNVETGDLPDDIEDQCRNTLQTIGRTLKEANFGFQDVVRVTYILPERAEFERCWPQLRAIFGEIRPPSTLLQAGLIDPNMRIEIEVTAYDPEKG